jgi:hypothetical protein
MLAGRNRTAREIQKSGSISKVRFQKSEITEKVKSAGVLRSPPSLFPTADKSQLQLMLALSRSCNISHTTVLMMRPQAGCVQHLGPLRVTDQAHHKNARRISIDVIPQGFCKSATPSFDHSATA